MLNPSPAPTPHEQAITRIAQFIRECPDTSGGVQLRRFLWSLYNMHHMVNLWDLASRVSGEPAQLVSQVLEAAMVGHLREDDIKRGLLICGAMENWDHAPAPESALGQINQAQQSIAAAIRAMPPCYAHTELVRMMRRLEELEGEVRLGQESEGGTRPRAT